MTNPLHDILAQLDLYRSQIDQAAAQIRTILNNGAANTKSSEVSPPRKKRTLSPAARKRIAMAQKKRWAAARKEKAKVASAGQ